jgi:hypothetical protein
MDWLDVLLMALVAGVVLFGAHLAHLLGSRRPAVAPKEAADPADWWKNPPTEGEE